MNDYVSLPIDYVISTISKWQSNEITAEDALEQLLTAQDKIKEEQDADEH
jgi:hypothetical protein